MVIDYSLKSNRIAARIWQTSIVKTTYNNSTETVAKYRPCSIHKILTAQTSGNCAFFMFLKLIICPQRPCYVSLAFIKRNTLEKLKAFRLKAVNKSIQNSTQQAHGMLVWSQKAII